MNRISVIVVAAVLLWPAAAAATTFVYQAYIADAPIGQVEVDVSIDLGRYRVAGEARSGGLIESVNPWRAQFFADGRLHADGPTMHRYYLFEQDQRKRREVTIEDGVLREVKNGKPRLTRPPLPGTDVLTALFVAPECGDIEQLHTGRHGYTLTLVHDDDQMCRFEVVDDDDDRYTAEVRFGVRDSLRVPVVIRVGGFLTGRMELVTVRPEPPGSR